jgi:hypothetical protein
MSGDRTDGSEPAATESLAEAYSRQTADPLDRLRDSPRRRAVVTVVGIVVGLVAALAHWLGFVLGGALVALPQVSIRRGLAAGLGFGVFAWFVFLTSLGTAGAFDTYVQMGPIIAISTATPILGGLLGSLLRGVV